MNVVRTIFSASLCVSPIELGTVQAQMVELECCIDEDQLHQLGPCVSGPEIWEAPAACNMHPTCVAGFGEDADLAERMCAGEPGELPSFERAICTRWNTGETPSMRCEVAPIEGIEPHSMFDSDDDGDLDLRDIAVFQQIRIFIPNLDQTSSVITGIECCAAESTSRRLGDCLSGPGEDEQPVNCPTNVDCTVEMSEPAAEGDFVHLICDAQESDGSAAGEPICESWPTLPEPKAEFCSAPPSNGVSTFSTFDVDGDADLDLLDYAGFQNSLD